MSSPAITPNPQQANPEQYAEYLKEQIAQQSNTTGLTQMAPNTSGARPQAHLPSQQPQQQQNQTFGPGMAGANKRQSMQNLVNSVKGVAQQFSQYAEQKQQRQYEQVTSRFIQANQGVQQAQSQVQQGQEMLRKASELLKANPQDPQAHQLVQQGQQMSQQGQAALKQNSTILNDMANDPKQHKVITKAFGIDDKNADSPERAAATAALKKQMGGQVGGSAAGMLSQLPQTQQLSPQAQQQEMARKAGIVGAPATGGQQLAAETRLSTTATTEQGKDQRAQLRSTLTAAMNGQKYDASGKLVPMTPDEIAKSPVLAAKMSVASSKSQLEQAQAELTKAKTNALPEQVKMAEAKVAVAQGNLMMRQKEFGIKVADEERKQLETALKTGGTITTPEGGKVDVGQLTGGRPLQSWAQQTVVQVQDRLSQVQALKSKLESLKDNNQPGYLAADRLSYAMGMGGENGELASEISNIELQKVVNAAQILKGSSRSWGALQAAIIHTPNAWTDSPKLMYQKLQTIENNLQDMQRDAIQYGQKNERSSEMPGQHAPSKPSAKPDKAVDDFLLNLK
jgi:hypothetical protein